jgi:mycothione reductase
MDPGSEMKEQWHRDLDGLDVYKGYARFIDEKVMEVNGEHIEATGVEVAGKGFIKIDPYLRTNVEGIWALGDIVPTHSFKHSANQEGRLVAHNIHHSDDLKAMDYHATPHAVFASPQVAGVGLTERDAKAAGIPYDVSQRSYDSIAWGMASHETDGFAKIIRHAGIHEVLGAHVIGPHASIVIQQMVAAVRLKMTTDELARVVYAHPALPELIENAVLDF